jgi:hypothetical protein
MAMATMTAAPTATAQRTARELPKVGLRPGAGAACVLTGRFSTARRCVRATLTFQSAWPTTPIWNGRGNCDTSRRKRKSML